MAQVMTLLIGESGTGKSNFAATWPTPIDFVDIECKANNLLPPRKARVEDNGELNQIQENVIRGAIEMHLREKFEATDQPQAYRKVMEHLLSLEPGRFETIVIDSWSALCEVACRQLHALKSTVGLPSSLEDYGIMYAKWQEFLPFLQALPCTHVVVTAHEDIVKDDLTGRMYMSPFSHGQKIRKEMPRKFDNVWRTFTNTTGEGVEYKVRTRPQGLFTFGKTIWPTLPQVGPQDFAYLMQAIKENRD